MNDDDRNQPDWAWRGTWALLVFATLYFGAHVVAALVRAL